MGRQKLFILEGFAAAALGYGMSGATGVLTELKAAIPELFGVAMCFLKGPWGSEKTNIRRFTYMAAHEKFKFNTLDEVREKLKSLQAPMELQEDLSPLRKEVKVGNRKTPNAFVVLPMEGCDSEKDGSPGDLVKRRYLRLAIFIPRSPVPLTFPVWGSRLLTSILWKAWSVSLTLPGRFRRQQAIFPWWEMAIAG